MYMCKYSLFLGRVVAANYKMNTLWNAPAVLNITSRLQMHKDMRQQLVLTASKASSVQFIFQVSLIQNQSINLIDPSILLSTIIVSNICSR